MHACMLLLCLTASLGAPPLPRPDYLGFVELALPSLDAAYTLRSCNPLAAKTPCNTAAELASAITALWEVRGAVNASAAARASQLMQWFVASWAAATANGTLPNPDRYDFFACEPIAHAFRGLLRLPGGLAGLGWSQGDIASARAATGDVCSPEMRGMWNQALSRSAGTVVALQAWPDLDEGGAWSAYARTVLSDWTTTHGYAENSPVYNSIAWIELLSLALDLDPAAADADAAARDTQAMGRHWRELFSPGGYMPAFGDAWSDAGSGATTWGFEEALYWPATFERLAAAAGNATEASYFSWAAASYFAFGAAQGTPALCSAAGGSAAPDPPPLPPGVASLSPRSLRYLLKAQAWRARGGGGYEAALPPLSTRAAARRLPPAGAWVPDKLVLTSALTPGGGTPYAMAELLSTSALYHCHVLQLGAVVSLVARNTTFLHHAGRDNYLAAESSTVVLWRDAGRAGPFPFPDAREAVRPGEWTLLELPTANLQPISQAPQDYHIKNLTHLHFFVRNQLLENITVDLAYIALQSPDTGAVLVIDDFSAPLPYPAWPNASVQSDPAAPGPAHRFLRITCAPGKSTNSRPPSTPPLALVFSASDYPILRLFWRPSANAPANDTGLMVIGHGPYTVPEGDFNPSTPLEGSNYDFGAGGIGDGAQYAQVQGFPPVATPFFPHFASALDEASVAAESSPVGDSFGSFAVRRHFSTGVTWSRTLVLLAEGALLAVDALAVAAGDEARAGGWLGGPSWLLQATQPAARLSASAFDVGGFNYTGCYGAGARAPSPERLLLNFFALGGTANASGAVAGTTLGALAGNVRVEAAYMHAPLAAAVAPAPPIRFVSVLVPHGAGAAPAPLAARVSAAREGGNSTVVGVPLESGGSAVVELGDDGSWTVSRS